MLLCGGSGAAGTGGVAVRAFFFGLEVLGASPACFFVVAVRAFFFVVAVRGCLLARF